MLWALGSLEAVYTDSSSKLYEEIVITVLLIRGFVCVCVCSFGGLGSLLPVSEQTFGRIQMKTDDSRNPLPALSLADSLAHLLTHLHTHLFTHNSITHPHSRILTHSLTLTHTHTRTRMNNDNIYKCYLIHRNNPLSNSFIPLFSIPLGNQKCDVGCISLKHSFPILYLHTWPD